MSENGERFTPGKLPVVGAQTLDGSVVAFMCPTVAVEHPRVAGSRQIVNKADYGKYLAQGWERSRDQGGAREALPGEGTIAIVEEDEVPGTIPEETGDPTVPQVPPRE